MPNSTHERLQVSRPMRIGIGVATAVVLVLLPQAFLKFGFLGAGLIAGLCAVILALAFSPLAMFALYFGTLFFAETTLPGYDITANQILAALFFLSFLCAWSNGKALRVDSAFLSLLASAAIYYAVSAAWGESSERGFVHFRYVAIYFFTALCLAKSLRTERTIHTLAWIVTAFTVIAAIAGIAEAWQKDILEAFAGRWNDAIRIKGYAKNPVVFGWSMLYAFPFAFFLYAESHTKALRRTALLMGLTTVFAAMLTFNRQAYLTIAILIAVSAILYKYRSRRTLVTGVTIMAVIMLVTIFPLVIKRFYSTGDITRDFSYLERRDSLLVGMEMIRHHPIFGVGLGSFPAVWKQYIPADYPTFYVQYDPATRLRYPDFGYLQLFAETGIVGLLAFVGILAEIMRKAWTFRRAAIAVGDSFAHNYSAMILTLAAFIAVTSFIQDTLLNVRVWIFFGVALLLDRKIIPFAKTVGEEVVSA